MSNPFILLGIILIFLGFILIFYGFIRHLIHLRPSQGVETKVKGGGLILIGPIPIVFGSDARYVIIAVILVIILMLILFFMYNFTFPSF